MKLSKTEWIAVTIALIVVFIFFYPFFGKSFSLGSSAERAERNVLEDLNLSTDARVDVRVVKVGEGEVVESGDIIAFHYVGSLEDGTIFGSTRESGNPFIYQLGSGRLIPGFVEGIRNMRVGGIRVLTIPAEKAYGERGIVDPNTGEYVIPPNSTITFEVEILSAGQ